MIILIIEIKGDKFYLIMIIIFKRVINIYLIVLKLTKKMHKFLKKHLYKHNML